MAFFHVLLDGSGTSGDGSTWDDASDATSAYIGSAGLITAAAATSPGDIGFIKNSESNTTGSIIIFPGTVAATVNPVKLYAVKSATTNTGGSIVQSDLIPGNRTGQATRAYAYGGETPPTITKTGAADIEFQGCAYIYGMIFSTQDNITYAGGSLLTAITFEEAKITVNGVTDIISFGNNGNVNPLNRITTKHCLIDAQAGNIEFKGTIEWNDFSSIISCTDSASFVASEFGGVAKFYGSGLSGIHQTMFDISDWHNGEVELWNCDMPAGHILTTGTATQAYTVTNNGSNDDASLTSSASVQEFAIHTHQGVVTADPSEERTGGGTDGAGGLWSYAVVANNVDDNFISVDTPWRFMWIEGDGTTQTLTVFVANSAADDAANDLEDDEIFLELLYPSEAGDAMYDYRPNEEAPTGMGRMQLLGSAADITDDAGSTWTSANNHQKLTAPIDPDYQGPLYWRINYSKSGGPTLSVDPLGVLS